MRSSSLFPLVGIAVSLSVSISAPTPAAAAEPTPSEISVARRLFEEGKAAEDAGRWREAAEKFRQAAAIKDTPGIRFHLARCEEESGALVEALVEYDRARELIEGGVKASDVERMLPEARERVRVRVAQLTLRVPAGVPGTVVTIDGKSVSTSVLGVPVPLNPGRHRIRASAPGRTPFDKELQMGPGEARELRLELPISPVAASTAPAVAPPPAVVARPAPPPAEESDAEASVQTRTIVLIGEGTLVVAALGAGIYFTVARSSAQSDLRKANGDVLAYLSTEDDGTACSMPTDAPLIDACGDLDRARQDRERAARWQVASFVGAGASAAALALTWALWPRASDGAAQVFVPSVALGAGRIDFGLRGSF